MSSPEPAGSSEPGPLDAERAKLRAAGYSDTEISQILISRVIAGYQSPPPVPGVMSNTLASIVAVAGHARGLVPTFRTDFVTVFNTASPLGARVGAFFALLLKFAVIAVLAYAGLQEWNQHIISATAIAGSEVVKRRAEACAARLKLLNDTTPAPNLTGRNIPFPAEWTEQFERYKKDCEGTE